MVVLDRSRGDRERGARLARRVESELEERMQVRFVDSVDELSESLGELGAVCLLYTSPSPRD